MDADHTRIVATGHLTMPDDQWEQARTRASAPTVPPEPPDDAAAPVARFQEIEQW